MAPVLPKICGFKRSICCTLMSVWAMIMLAAMSGLLSNNSIAFIDDLAVADNENEDLEKFYELQDKAYVQASQNCWHALLLYFGTFTLSLYHWIAYTKQHASK